METLLYQNPEDSLDIVMNEKGEYFIKVYPHDEHDSLPLPKEYVENFPLSEEEIPPFIEEIRKSHLLLLQIVNKESDLITALREIKSSGRDKFIN